MAYRLPPGFISVAEAAQKRDFKDYHVIGVVVDYLPPTQTRGSDCTVKLTIWDESCLKDEDLNLNGFVVRFFAQQIGLMPRVEEVGDVVLIRNLKTKSVGSQWIGISNSATQWNVLPASGCMDSTDPSCLDIQQRGLDPGHPAKSDRRGKEPSVAEKQYARALLRLKDPATLRGPPKSTALEQAAIITASGGKPPAPNNRKFRLLRDLVDPREHTGAQFVDLIGEVKRVFYDKNPVEIKITDYTEHPLLYDYCQKAQQTHGFYSDTAHWQGPWGKKTITLNAWDNQAEYIRDLVNKNRLELGMIMSAQNVNIRLDSNGAVMQGHLRGAAGNTGTNIRFFNPRDAESNPNLKALLQRRCEYMNAEQPNPLGFSYLGFNEQAVSKKRAASEADSNAAEQTAKARKNAKKREKKRMEQRAGEQRNIANQHVRCEAIEIPLTTITSILDQSKLDRKTPAGNPLRLPFQNCKYKSKVQVIDFFPDNLEDFATPHQVSDHGAMSDDDGSEMSLDFTSTNPRETKWRWYFFLLVQDPDHATKAGPSETQPTMLLQVSGQDGDYLLNMEASDLRANTTDFARLKQKLFVLWGDLQEKKAEHDKSGLELREQGIKISCKPFECLIKEFGVRARTSQGVVVEGQWERMFGLFKTNIG